MTMPNEPTTTLQPLDAAAERGDHTATTGGTRAQIREVKNQVVDHAKSSFRQARDSAGTSLTESRQQAAERIGSVATAFRRTGDHLRSENLATVAGLTDSMADGAERLSTYLRDRDFGAVRADLEGLARRKPALLLGGALVLGLLGARFLKSSERGGGDA